MVERIRSGQTVALISDAGTPAISDPGFLLVRACKQGWRWSACRGTAFVPALSCFGGYQMTDFV